MRYHTRKRGFTLVELMTVVAVAAVLIGLVLMFTLGGSSSGEAEAIRALEASGFSDAKITSSSLAPFNGCDKSETAYDATAKNPKGIPVSVTVCVGWFFKGATIRTR